MAFAPIILRGDLEVNDTAVNSQVMAFTVRGTRGTIEIPATLGTRKSFAGGDDQYEIEMSYLPDVDATALHEIFWTALADAEGTITFGGKYRSAATSATNPRYAGEALVTAAAIGGTVNTVSTNSVTFPCVDRPTKVTSDA